MRADGQFYIDSNMVHSVSFDIKIYCYNLCKDVERLLVALCFMLFLSLLFLLFIELNFNEFRCCIFSIGVRTQWAIISEDVIQMESTDRRTRWNAKYPQVYVYVCLDISPITNSYNYYIVKKKYIFIYIYKVRLTARRHSLYIYIYVLWAPAMQE